MTEKAPLGQKDLQGTCCFSILVQFLLPWLATAPTPKHIHTFVKGVKMVLNSARRLLNPNYFS